jgi:hypothetical protein
LAKSERPRLQIQTNNLPADQQQRVHPDSLANEREYLLLRDNLLPQYRGQWVAVQGGKVIAAGAKLMEVMDQACAFGGHPFFALVGAEDPAIFRVHRLVFAYDQAYQSFPLPRLTATFWNHAESQARQHADVIPDTGADVSVHPDTDCKSDRPVQFPLPDRRLRGSRWQQRYGPFLPSQGRNRRASLSRSDSACAWRP